MSKSVYRVQGRDLETLEYTPGMNIANGDVYGFDDPTANVIWIWVGSKSSVEESTVAAWFINKIDQERGGVPEVFNIDEGSEPMLFRENWTINVVEGDTEGFLTKAELDYVEFKLWRIFTEVETEMHDETIAKEVEISRKSLDSGDVFVLDGNGAIYCWIGKGSNLEEKLSGQKLMQKIDADRNYTPIQYTVHEDDGDNWEQAFYDLLDKIESMAPADRKELSVEDQRELKYVAEEAKTAEEHKAHIDANYETTDPDKVPERMIQAGTDEHRKMVSGSSVKMEELPQEGTVAARLAAIKARAEGGTEPEKTGYTTPVAPPVQTPLTGQSHPSTTSPPGAPVSQTSRPTQKVEEPKPQVSTPAETPTVTTSGHEVSKTYGGAPEPSLTELASGPETGDTVAAKIHAECVAVAMHYTVWTVDKPCAVCGMGPEDCPKSAEHATIIARGGTCDVCNATE